MLKRKVSLAGKRTPVSRLAGENSTTEPPMLITSSIYPAQSHIKYCIHAKNKDCIGVESNLVSRVAGENSTTEPPMLVTLTICPAQSYRKVLHSCKKQTLHWESNPGLPRGRREFYH